MPSSKPSASPNSNHPLFVRLLLRRHSAAARPLVVAVGVYFLALVPSGGCATWNDAPRVSEAISDAEPTVPSNQRRVRLEVEFLPVPLSEFDAEFADSVWQQVDETPLDVELRGRLAQNGLRAGLLSQAEPFRKQLQQSIVAKGDVVDQFLDQASIASDLSHDRQQIPLRFGRRYEVPLRQPIEGSHTSLVRFDGETIGRTLSHPQHVLVLTGHPGERAGEIRLHVRLEIQHGESKQKFVSSDTALRIDNRREAWSLPELDLSLATSEGKSLVLGAAVPATGLGKEMLTGVSSDHANEQVFVLVHVLQVPTAIERLP